MRLVLVSALLCGSALSMSTKQRVEKLPSFLEWCSANQPLCRGWIIPLWSFTPRGLMVWARYSNSSAYGQEPGGAFERWDDVLDNTTTLAFWSAWVIAPSAPLCAAIAPHAVSDWSEAILRMLLMLGLLEDLGLVVSLICIPLASSSSKMKWIAKKEAFGVVLALVFNRWDPDGVIPVGAWLTFHVVWLLRRLYIAYWIADDDLSDDALVILHRLPRLVASRLHSSGISARTVSHLASTAIMGSLAALLLLRDQDGDGDIDMDDVVLSIDTDGNGHVGTHELAIIGLSSLGLWKVSLYVATLFVLGLELGREHAIGESLQYLTPAMVERVHELGSGAFGTVYSAKWLGASVAVKVLKTRGGGPLAEADLADLKKEARLLARLRHPHVVAFLGVCLDVHAPLIMTELMNDTLTSMLRRMSNADKLRVVRDVAAGMVYLHSKLVMHGDLKPDNVLLLKDSQEQISCAKVCDFGLSQTLHHLFPSAIRGGTAVYKAPEMHTPMEPKTRLLGLAAPQMLAMDVYAFGIVLNEALTGVEAFEAEVARGISQQDFVAGVIKGLRPRPIHQGKLGALISRCWDGNPTQRPTMAAALEEIEAGGQEAVEAGGRSAAPTRGRNARSPARR